MIQSVTALTLAKANLDLKNEVRVVSVALVQDQVLWVQDQEAALHLATRNGAQEVLRVLLCSGQNVNLPDKVLKNDMMLECVG